MHILLVSATGVEIQHANEYLGKYNYSLNGNRFSVLITGVGMLSSSHYLTERVMQDRPDLVIAAGIAGSFRNEIKPGDVVMIQEEILADTGVFENDVFVDVFDLGLTNPNQPPFEGKVLINRTDLEPFKLNIGKVRGCTVNEISTCNERINIIRNKYHAHVESMEGAAIHFVCIHHQLPFIHIRSISNYVGERDKNNWKFKEALEALHQQLMVIFNSLHS
jgi:futalosine hydrolase